MHVQVRLTSAFAARLSRSFMRTDVAMSRRCPLFCDLSPISSRSSDSSQVSATGIYPGPSLHFLYPIHPSHRASLPLSAVKVKSNWILPSPVYPLRRPCAFAFMRPRTVKTCGSALYPWLEVSLHRCPLIHVRAWTEYIYSLSCG